MSGVNLNGRELRKGVGRDRRLREGARRHWPQTFSAATDKIAHGHAAGRRDGGQLLGLVHLKDVVKGGMKDHAQLRYGHPVGGLPATIPDGAAIASEAGVDDFLAQATPKDKPSIKKSRRRAGWSRDRRRTNAPRSPGRRRRGDEHRHHGRQGSRQHGRSRQQSDEADPVVAIGKQLLMTRGALTAFSIANDVANAAIVRPCS
jgi:K+-transporting ATPase ATPase B chain